MSKVATRSGGPSRGIRAGLRGQMALLGVSGVLVTGAICAAALNYASIVQNESSDANRFRIRVTSLSQGFLQSRQIASDFLRKPSEVSIKSHDENYERQLADLSSVETFTAALSGDESVEGGDLPAYGHQFL